jgi:TIR domain
VLGRSPEMCGQEVTLGAKDFFVSYTSADQAWAEWIADQLEAAGLSTVLQAWDFRPGENFVLRMNEALEQADRVLAVLSPRYFSSPYATDEWTAALIRDRSGGDRLLPVRIEACDLPPLLANRIYIDLVGLDEQAAATRLRAGVRQGRAKPAGRRPFPEGVRPPRSRFPGWRPEIFSVPARNPNFTGRGDLLQDLRGVLQAQGSGAVLQAGALYGLGGVGKTELAVEYAHRYMADYDLVWWVPAEQPLAIPGRLAALARRLKIPEVPDQDEQLGLLWDELPRWERWLLLYDNATEPRELAPYRPPAGGGQVLITSRNPAWGALARPIYVDVLEREQAIGLLLSRARDQDQASANELADQLGDLPLALEQAAAYLEQTGMPVGTYVVAYHRRRGQLLAKGRPLTYQGQVDTTWQLTIEKLAEIYPAALDLLQLCAFMAPEAIPMDVCSGEPHRLPSALAAAVLADGDAGLQEAAGGVIDILR